MMRVVLGLVAAGMLAAALPQLAFADQVPPAEAKLATPAAEPRKVTIDGRIWRCEGDLCKGAEQGNTQPAKRECAKVAKVLGPIVAYKDGKKDLAEADVAACNAAVKS
jgi:hypothetical protein